MADENLKHIIHPAAPSSHAPVAPPATGLHPPHTIQPGSPAAAPAPAAPAPTAPAPAEADDGPQEELPEAISLVADHEEEDHSSKMKFGGKLGVEAKSSFKRRITLTGTGATRCRVFHSKIADAPLAYLEKQINEWIDSDPQIEVKEVGHMVGVLEGKTHEPNVIIMIWY